MTGGVGDVLPGLLLLVIVAAAAHLLGTAVPFLTPLVVAIGIGALLANTVRRPAWAERGIAVHSLALETAIVLLGASISVDAMIAAGPHVALLVVSVVAFGLTFVTVLSRSASLDDRLGSLLAAGSSICGVSAIAATAPACDADESQIAHAAATILLFDAVTLVAFPVVGRTLDVSAQFYGVWIGLAMFSTGPVAAAGFAHSATAGQWATLTKLARNTLIGAVAVWYSIRYAGRGDRTRDHTLGRMWTDFPKFLLGFLVLAVLTNAGALPDPVVESLGRTSDALFLLAFAGLGFEIRLAKMRDAGLAPIVVVGASLLVVSTISYLLVALFL